MSVMQQQQQHPDDSRPQVSPPRPVHTHFHQPSVLVPPSPYLHEEIPKWLRVYCKASPALDHNLKWDLFELGQLECYDSMLNRLFRDGLEEIVMRYESLRTAMAQRLLAIQAQHGQFPQARITEIPADAAQEVLSIH